MPGSIQVSVLDFKELPSSANSVKVSLGKVEYEAGEKGTFSFLLTNLRDNLIITIQDPEGNPVSHSGVRTMSIIEKGTWDDLFPVEGGGLIHMKLQFVLSEEERNRIRSMRESAMKKKEDEILSTRLRNAESVNSLSSSLRRHEVSDVLTATSSQDFQRSSFNNYAAKASLLTFQDDISGKAAASGDGIKEESFQSQTFPNATDRRENTSSSPMTEGMHQKALVQDTETQAPLTDLVKNKSPNSKTSNYAAEELDKPNLEKKIPYDVQSTSVERASTPLLQETEVNSTKNSEIQLQQVDVPKRSQGGVRQKALVEDTETRALTDLVKKNEDNLAEKLDKQNLEKKIPSDVKRTSKESMPTPLLQESELNSTKDHEIQLEQADVPKRSREGVRQKALVEDTGTHALTDLVKKNKEAESKPSNNLAERLDKQNLEEKIPSYVKKTSKESTPSTLSRETEVDTLKNNEIQLQQADAPKKSQEAVSREVGSSSSTISEKIRSFSPRLVGEPDKQGPLEETPRSIRKMISVFESSISQDRVPLKPPGVKSYRVGTLCFLKDHVVEDYSEKSESRLEMLKKSEMSSSTRLRNSYSTEPSETDMQSKGVVASGGDKLISADPKETENVPKDSTTVASVGVNNEEKFALTETNTKELPKSPEEDATVSGRMLEDDKESNTKHTEALSNKNKDVISAEDDRATGLSGDCVVEAKSHQEKTVSSIPDSNAKVIGEVRCGTGSIVKKGEEMHHMSGNSSPKSSDEEASTGSVGQAIKIALVVGLGVLVLLFRHREPGKGKKKENNRVFKTQVFMNKRGSIEEQLRKIDVLKLS